MRWNAAGPAPRGDQPAIVYHAPYAWFLPNPGVQRMGHPQAVLLDAMPIATACFRHRFPGLPEDMAAQMRGESIKLHGRVCVRCHLPSEVVQSYHHGTNFKMVGAYDTATRQLLHWDVEVTEEGPVSFRGPPTLQEYREMDGADMYAMVTPNGAQLGALQL